MRKVAAKLKRIIPSRMKYANDQGTSSSKVFEYASRVRKSTPPPVLLLDLGPKKFVLDGFHRLAAAAMKGASISAWVVPADKKWKKLLEEHFDGEIPFYYGDLDDHIICGETHYDGRKDH